MKRIRLLTAVFVAVALTGLGVGVASASTTHRGTTHRSTSHKTDRGPRGPRGRRGPRGPQGLQGLQGATGPAGSPGNTTFTNYHATIATAGASSSSPNTVTLFTDGPFTVTGECYITTGSTVEAATYVQTSSNGASLNDYEDDVYDANSFNVSTGAVNVGEDTEGTIGSPEFYGPYDGSTAMESPDGSLFINLFAGNAVYVTSGSSTPACTFFGFYDSY